jgi:hypothetical protein
MLTKKKWIVSIASFILCAAAFPFTAFTAGEHGKNALGK